MSYFVGANFAKSNIISNIIGTTDLNDENIATNITKTIELNNDNIKVNIVIPSQVI